MVEAMVAVAESEYGKQTPNVHLVGNERGISCTRKFRSSWLVLMMGMMRVKEWLV
jgi:hypothetical protein